MADRDEERSRGRRISRRDFLYNTALAAGLISLGTVATVNNNRFKQEEEAKNNPTSPKPTEAKPNTPVASPRASATAAPAISPTATEPSKSSIQVRLEATATTVAERKEQSSFIESDGFTKEMFERARRGTYMIEISGVGNDKYTVRGTAWLAKVDGDSYYFATNAHVLKAAKEIAAIKVWRPNIDKEVLTLTKWGEAHFDPDNRQIDLALIKYQGEYKTDQKPEVLKWEDFAKVKGGEKMMVIGFPFEFWDSKSSYSNTVTAGSVLPVDNDVDLDRYAGQLTGLYDKGGSGSPVIALRQGQPVVVGIVYASGFPNPHFPWEQPNVNFYGLAIQKLIDALDR